jgi:hypothetical protein
MKPFRDSRSRSLTVARARFGEGEELPEALLPPCVARSWGTFARRGRAAMASPQYEL